MENIFIQVPIFVLTGLCLIKLAGIPGNPESPGEFATGKYFIRKEKNLPQIIKILYHGLYDRNVFFVLQ